MAKIVCDKCHLAMREDGTCLCSDAIKMATVPPEGITIEFNKVLAVYIRTCNWCGELFQDGDMIVRSGPGLTFYHFEKCLGKALENAAIDRLGIDNINQPPHYTSHPSGIEHIEISQHHNFCIGAAIKYLWRQGLKDGFPSEEDLNKAIWYIMKELQNNEMKVTAKEWEKDDRPR